MITLKELVETHKTALAAEIKKRRKAKGLTLQKVADYCKVDFRTVQKWEREENVPNMRHIGILDKLFK